MHQDWVVKHWYPTHGLFSNCVWLFPADQAAWFVRTEVTRAKQQGLLEEAFVPQARRQSYLWSTCRDASSTCGICIYIQLYKGACFPQSVFLCAFMHFGRLGTRLACFCAFCMVTFLKRKGLGLYTSLFFGTLDTTFQGLVLIILQRLPSNASE